MNERVVTRPATLLGRLGVDGPATSPRMAWGLLAALLGVYAIAFLVFYPEIALGTDEASYIRQAKLFLDGRTSQFSIDPRDGTTIRFRLSGYPAGTAAMMLPFVWTLGDAGAFLSPFLCLVAGVLLTAAWIRSAGGSPIFAVLVLGFPSALVLGRVAMSDVPSLAVVSLGLWLFWRGLDRGWGWFAAAGLVAGASICVRESNALPFVAFFLGAVLRKDRGAWALVVGGLAGLAVRAASGWIVYGDPLYYRVSSVLFGQDSFADVLPLHLFGLLVLAPGGLVMALLYRGRRAPELAASVVLFLVFYASVRYAALELSPTSRVVMGLRFFVPLLPILAFATAEVVPRLFEKRIEPLSDRPRGVVRILASGLVIVWLLGVAAGAGAVHWAFDRLSAPHARLRNAIYQHTGHESVLVSNLTATGRYLEVVGTPYIPLDRGTVDLAAAARMVSRYGAFYAVFLDRDDSSFYRAEARANAAFIASLEPEPELLSNEDLGPMGRLRVWRVNRVKQRAPRRG